MAGPLDTGIKREHLAIKPLYLIGRCVSGGIGETDMAKTRIKIPPTIPTTRSCGTAPSNPQPNADCTETCTALPA